jgi:aminoglycoside phosphotransferase (APT) family kinase protein
MMPLMSEQQPTVRPVAPQHAIDVQALSKWMTDTIGPMSAPLEVAQFRGGQSNPTYLLTTGDRRFVLRRKPPGKLLPSAHAVDREYRVVTALAGTDVPVARTFGLCEDEAVIGTAFYVMEYVAGRILWDPTLPELAPGERGRVHDEVNRVIAALHAVDYRALGLGDFGKAEGYIARQVARWTKQYQSSETEKIAAMDHLMAWLPANLPPGDETSIVHGDYRIDNVIFDRTTPRIRAVIDWELSTLGHPLADFAYHCMAWRIPPGVFRGLGGLDLPALGIPTESEYVMAYCRRTGRTSIAGPEWEYYMAYNMFRLAAILQGVLARALQGNASSAEAMQTGRAARPIAEMAWAQVERLKLA